MKLCISIGILALGTIGGGIGNMMDHQSFFAFGLGGWSILLSIIGSFAGIWAGYKAAKMMGV